MKMELSWNGNRGKEKEQVKITLCAEYTAHMDDEGVVESGKLEAFCDGVSVGSTEDIKNFHSYETDEDGYIIPGIWDVHFGKEIACVIDALLENVISGGTDKEVKKARTEKEIEMAKAEIECLKKQKEEMKNDDDFAKKLFGYDSIDDRICQYENNIKQLEFQFYIL